MRTSRFLLFILLALFYANTVSAIIVGNQFTRDGITYEVTFMDVAHDGHPARYEVKFVSSNLAGALNIPETVADLNNQYTFKVTAIAANSTVPNATSVTIPSNVTTINANSFKTPGIQSIQQLMVCSMRIRLKENIFPLILSPKMVHLSVSVDLNLRCQKALSVCPRMAFKRQESFHASIFLRH